MYFKNCFSAEKHIKLLFMVFIDSTISPCLNLLMKQNKTKVCNWAFFIILYSVSPFAKHVPHNTSNQTKMWSLSALISKSYHIFSYNKIKIRPRKKIMVYSSERILCVIITWKYLNMMKKNIQSMKKPFWYHHLILFFLSTLFHLFCNVYLFM